MAFVCSVLFFAQSITVVISIIFGIVVCQQYHVCPRNIPRIFRKMSTFNHEHPTNNPSGVGTDSSRPYFHIIKYAYSFPRTRMSTLSNTYIHSTKHVCSFLILRFFHICGHDKSDPYGCLRSAKMLLTGWNFVVVYVYSGTINRPLRLLTGCQ